MCIKSFKNVILIFSVFVCFIIPQVQAARLANGEYTVVNGSFEDSNSFDSSVWMNWLGDNGNTTTIINDSNFAYYGNKSIALHRNANNTVIFQNIEFSTNGPQKGDTPEGGAWIMFDSGAAASEGDVVVQVKYVVGTTPYPIATSATIQNKQAGKWYYIKTIPGGIIPNDAEKIQVVVDSNTSGTVYVDFVQCGKVNSITGNPSKLAIVEYQTWFAVPSYLPDWRRFTDPTYSGFSDYNSHDWKHWEWGWDPDGGYNNDPGLHKQIGIKAGRNYTFLNASFEEDGYGDWSQPGWRRWPENADNNTTTEKAYDGTHSIKLTNHYAGTHECMLYQLISCHDILHLQDDAPNEKEMISASVWVNFGDINDINLAGGNFWIEVIAKHDPDCNVSTPNDVNTLIAKSYEHISPEYVRTHATPSGWVKISTRPVNKGVIPWWTYWLEVKVRFFYAGTIYVDKVEVGEAELSNVERSIASDKTPLIGPYDSNDDNLIDYHLGLCKSMLFDAMLINYYGHQFDDEEYQRVVFGKIADKAEDEDLKVCVFYEPKVHLKRWGDVNYYADMTNISQMSPADIAKVNEYINDVTDYNYVSQIADINLVKHYIQMAAVQDDIKYVLDTWGWKKSYLAYNGKPVIGIFGLYSSKYDDGMTEEDWRDIYYNLTQCDGSYKFIYIGDTVPADGYSQWFDCFTGMMNWYLVDDIVRDRMEPNYQDVYERSRDIVNGRAVNWASAEQDRFAIGLTYPQFNDQGVGAWAPVDTQVTDPEGNKVYRYYINRTPVWNGDFYRKNNQGLITCVNDIDWLVVATFNDWNEGSSIEPSVEDGYMYPIITQNMIEEFKDIAQVSDELIQDNAEKFIHKNIKMDVDGNIQKQQPDPAIKKTYYTVMIYQFDSAGNYIQGDLVLKDWSCEPGRFTSNFAGRNPNLASYEPYIRISTESGKGWVKIDGMNEGSWSESFSTVSNWYAFEGAAISTSASVAMIKDGADGCGGARWTGARVPYSAGDVFTIDVNSVYTYGTSRFYSGAACMKMVLDYEGFNTCTQDQLHDYAVALNELTDQDTCIDPKGMQLAMNNFEIDGDYNYGWEKYTSLETMYDRICYWMAYDVPGVTPRPQKMPAIIPLNGNYMDWVVVNGYSTDEDPYTSTSYTINGFWITDPEVTGIGKNIYLTAEELGIYYKKIVSDDSLNGYYTAVMEPPMAEPAKVIIAKAVAYQGFKGDEKSIKAAAIAGLNNNLLKNKQFKSAYKDCKPGKPISAAKGKDNYFIVPFTKNNGCSVAVIIDGKTGAFRQASYNDVPDKQYLGKFDKVKKSKNICRSKNLFLPNSK